MSDIGTYDAAFVKGHDKPRKRDLGYHVIASIHYPPGIKARDYDQAPMTCICGWEGTSGEWNQHRAEMKLGKGVDSIPEME